MVLSWLWEFLEVFEKVSDMVETTVMRVKQQTEILNEGKSKDKLVRRLPN